MTDYVRYLREDRELVERANQDAKGGWVVRHPIAREAEKLLGKFDNDAYVVDGVVRWKSNNAVPPADIVELWSYAEKPFDAAKSTQIRQAELAKFMAEYRAVDANRETTPEEIAEARAAFGPGQEVVNAISGRRFNT